MSTEPIKRGFNCREIKKLLPEYLDQNLQEEVCEHLKAHLEECEDCRIFVKTAETTIILYKHCPGSDVPDEVRIDLRQSLRARIEGRRGEEES
jgi:predicted anti-sigma-YlaC factor YlaD